MAGGFFIKLAASNIKKNKRTYIPYLLTCMVTVAIYYIIKSLSLNPGLEKMLGADHMSYLMLLGSYVAGAFAFVFLFYTNSFLVKRRKKEFGVFNILGMEKKHLIRVLGWENVYVTGISLGLGLLIGILLDKVMFLIIIKAIGVGIPLGFFISAKAIGATVLLFAAIFLLIFLYSVRQCGGKGAENKVGADCSGDGMSGGRLLYCLYGEKSTCVNFVVFCGSYAGDCRDLPVVYCRKHCGIKNAAQK